MKISQLTIKIILEMLKDISSVISYLCKALVQIMNRIISKMVPQANASSSSLSKLYNKLRRRSSPATTIALGAGASFCIGATIATITEPTSQSIENSLESVAGFTARSEDKTSQNEQRKVEQMDALYLQELEAYKMKSEREIAALKRELKAAKIAEKKWIASQEKPKNEAAPTQADTSSDSDDFIQALSFLSPSSKPVDRVYYGESINIQTPGSQQRNSAATSYQSEQSHREMQRYNNHLNSMLSARGAR